TSRRGRSYLRMTILNRTLVDTLIERALGTDASAGNTPQPETETAKAESAQSEDTEQTEESV
ncbi:MAG TPA: hypothetical protein VFT63_04815, partial [bacterium]|nr:hypothetical protein [bacterium]